MKTTKKFAVENFNFFYARLTEEMVEFENLVSNRLSFLLASELSKGALVREKEEVEIYKKVCLLYTRLIKEYQFILKTHGGKVPKQLMSKVETSYAVGEMIQRYQSILQTIEEDNIDDFSGGEEV